MPDETNTDKDQGLSLSSLIPTEVDLNNRLIWIEFKGVEFQIRYISKLTLATIAEKCAISTYDTTKRSRTRSIDPVRFSRKLAEVIVHAWKGATISTLANIMPLDTSKLTPEQKTAEVPFTVANVCAVLSHAHELDTYIQECATDASMFRDESEVHQEKNSLSSQSGS